MNCKVKKCSKPVRVKSLQLCYMHYQRLHRYHGELREDRPSRLDVKEYVSSDGYVMIKTEKGWRLKHRVLMEKHLGRSLHPLREQVHHKDGNKLNNKILNLKVMGIEKHSRGHSSKKAMAYARKFRRKE